MNGRESLFKKRIILGSALESALTTISTISLPWKSRAVSVSIATPSRLIVSRSDSRYRILRSFVRATHLPRPLQAGLPPRIAFIPTFCRDLVIDQQNQVWSTGSTYVPMPQGFAYLVAVMDWFSRYVLSWRISNSLESISAWRLWTRPSPSASPRFLTPTKAASSPPLGSLATWRWTR